MIYLWEIKISEKNRDIEKMNIVRIFDFSTILTAIVYPISTHWCWGDGGWLSSRGFYDFAGSGVVHVSGGVHALVGNMTNYNSRTYIFETVCTLNTIWVSSHFYISHSSFTLGAIILGPRIDRFRDDNSKYISGHSIHLISLGAFILIFGFMAFNAGSQVNKLCANWNTMPFIGLYM